MEYYLAIQRNEALIHTTTWLDLENIRLRSQPRRITYCTILYEKFRSSKSIETESGLVAACGWCLGKEMGNMEGPQIETWFLFGVLETSETRMDDDYTTL